MELKQLHVKMRAFAEKYKFAALVLIIGLALLLIPGKDSAEKSADPNVPTTQSAQNIELEALAEILQSVQGAGKVKVLLSISAGEKTVYQTDTNVPGGNNGSTRIETVIVTDSQRNEAGLVSQVNPPKYLGAIVVCQGADKPAVKLAITEAVSKLTGLGADAICVLKMN